MRVKFILILPTNLIDEFLSKSILLLLSPDRLPFLLCSSKISSIILKAPRSISVMIKKDKKVKEKKDLSSYITCLIQDPVKDFTISFDRALLEKKREKYGDKLIFNPA